MSFGVSPAGLPDALVITPAVHADDRGWFCESWNARDFAAATGLDLHFVQDNHSCSARNVLRGLHYQIGTPQGRLIRVIAGAVFDVIVDLRRHSPAFGQWRGRELSAANRQMLWVPPGFAHGFLALEEKSEILYKTTTYWNSAAERSLLWNDPDLGITWPLQGAPQLSTKDQVGMPLRNAETYP
ncbi:MAG: dTDP-4-dehydrorhamnose 3,5-epimerase [Burkholderiales bacterium]|nr:dTDP-4-dehydrorhamnose 3,5-epimerase [Burkholderiales bacterium]